MQHVDPEVLALLALGEHGAASDDEHSHLAACAVCRAEEASLAQVVEVARADDRGLVAPPPEVWERVRAEVGRAEPEPAAVIDLASRRRRPSVLWGAVAASVALVAGAGVGVLWERSQVPEPPAEIAPVAVAEAELEPLPDWPTSAGRAVVTESTGGELEIVVDVGGAEAGDGYREVWLIADDLSGMVSLGVLEGTSGTFPVPAGLDLATYSLVDVSEEPFDGDPTHSGDSIVRGGLTEA